MTDSSIASARTEMDRFDDSLLQRLDLYFETVVADTPDLRRKAHELRYQVYCLEQQGFEDASAFPDGLEHDSYDDHAVHGLLIHRATQTAMGTVRLVLPLPHAPERSFAIQSLVDTETLQLAAVPFASTGEVSRFCISRQFRRRATDTLYEEAESTRPSGPSGERRSGPLMRLGLIQLLVRISARYGITHWCAVMEPTLLRMLDAMAIRFIPIGPPVEHHGLRQPCICRIADALTAMKHEKPAFWEVLTRAGTFTA